MCQRLVNSYKETIQKLFDFYGIKILNQWYGSVDPDPFQIVTDPLHWLLLPELIEAGTKIWRNFERCIWKAPKDRNRTERHCISTRGWWLGVLFGKKFNWNCKTLSYFLLYIKSPICVQHRLYKGTRVADPDSIGSVDPDPDSIGSVDPDPESRSGSGSRRAKMTNKSRKNL